MRRQRRYTLRESTLSLLTSGRARAKTRNARDGEQIRTEAASERRTAGTAGSCPRGAPRSSRQSLPHSPTHFLPLSVFLPSRLLLLVPSLSFPTRAGRSLSFSLSRSFRSRCQVADPLSLPRSLHVSHAHVARNRRRPVSLEQIGHFDPDASIPRDAFVISPRRGSIFAVSYGNIHAN